MRPILALILSLVLSTTIQAQEFDQNSSANYSSGNSSFLSNYGFRFGVVQTAPGLIVDNTDKDSSGHIQETVDYGYGIGIFSTPDRSELIEFFIHLDYFTYTMEQQVLNNDEQVSLGSRVSGDAIELVPGFALNIPFFSSSYVSLGIGYGIKISNIEGNMYLTDGNVSVNCESAVSLGDKSSIKSNCERHRFSEQILTYTLVNNVDIKLGDFLFRWTQSTSNSSGSADDSSERQAIDEHEFTVAMTSMSLSYLIIF